MDKTGFIYVLTNESFHRDNWVKIGYAEDVEKRVKELSNTAVPLPYEIYCTYEIPRLNGVKDPDKLIHDLIQTLNPNLRISQNREFFEIYPWDAYSMLLAIAQMHNKTDKLIKNKSNSADKNSQDEDNSVDILFPPQSDIRQLFEKVKKLVFSIDPTLEEHPTLNYVTYKKGKQNTVSMWPHRGWIEVVLNAKNGQISDVNGLLLDISGRKWSSAQYAFKFYDDTEEVDAKNLIEQTINLKRK